MEKEKIEEYLKVLACPKCKKDLEYKSYQNKEGFYCKNCQLFYPIVEDIPVMLIEEALKVDLS
jgi:uncharacterized protein YbaR (Trm112 family)